MRAPSPPQDRDVSRYEGRVYARGGRPSPAGELADDEPEYAHDYGQREPENYKVQNVSLGVVVNQSQERSLLSILADLWGRAVNQEDFVHIYN